MKIRCYLKEGWTIGEYTDEEWTTAYWIVAPDKERIISFPTKKEAREYWERHGHAMRSTYGAPLSFEAGQQLAEDCGLDWDDLDEFERESWSRMARDKK